MTSNFVSRNSSKRFYTSLSPIPFWVSSTKWVKPGLLETWNWACPLNLSLKITTTMPFMYSNSLLDISLSTPAPSRCFK